MRDRLYLAIAAVDLAAWLAYLGSERYHQLRRVLVGLDQIAWGMVFFLIAMAISLRKAGVWTGFAVKSIARFLTGWLHLGWSGSDPPRTQIRQGRVQR
ncbi:MAG: hypothetical protein ACHRXM_29095 [Isosphaerales bacterium]